ncbi:hypothetical protein [Dysgonomonas sp. 520]|uniref:hypothetical protein n=1 Tax=Dysgonomonas sp. 520 TaxID=2302931 RepID=UPI0013D4F1FC|nr:hypothetical protein [Dysgonomonas sp. 520]NDW10808.1 hypothetical protein [Dysgonomonas sp. 520]
MAQFKLVKGSGTVRTHDLNTLREAIFELVDESDSFIVLEPKKPISDSIYLQAVHQEGIYIAEIRFVYGSEDNYKHYSKSFTTKEELLEVFAQYYEEEKVPDIRTWHDDTVSFSEESDEDMVKLYKPVDGEMKYFEVWLTDTGLTIHTGVLGDTGKTEDFSYKKDSELSPRKAMAKFVFDQKERGYAEIEDLEELVVQYSYSDNDDQNKMLDKRNKVEDILNDCLGWTGNGHCDGGDIGSGTMNLFCYVVDKDIAAQSILEVLKEENLMEGMKLAYLDEKEEFKLIYPKEGNFSII